MKLLGLLFVLFFTSTAGAQDQPQEVEKGELVSRYWLEEPLTLGATFGFPNHLFSLSAGGTNIDYSPAQVTDLSLALGYGPFQISWKVPLPQGASNRNTYGKTNYDDFSFEYGRDRVAASAYYQSFSGFYTDLSGNTGNYARVSTGKDSSAATTPTTTSSPSKPADIVKRPDIHTKHYGAIGWYAFPMVGEGNQAFKISFHSLSENPSPGFNLDLVTHLFYDRAMIEAGLPFVPEKKADAFQQGAKLQGVETHSAGTGAGLASSYVFESSKFFLDGLLIYGGGAQRQKLSYIDDTRFHTKYLDNVNFRMGVNYKSDSSNAGLHFWVNTMSSRAEDLRFSSSNMAMELSFSRTI